MKIKVLHKTKHLLVMLFALMLAAQINAQISFPSTDSDVSYSSVTAREYRAADQLLRYGAEPFQVGRLWLPDLANTPPTLTVFIHGSCWLDQFYTAHTFPAATSLPQPDCAVCSPEYSCSGLPSGGSPDSYNEIEAGIQWIGNLSEYCINEETVVIVGHSAGDHLALLADIEFPNSDAVAGLGEITDIVTYAAGTNDCETATLLLRVSAFALAKELYQKADPVGLNLHSRSQLFHGTVDSIVNVSQSILANATPSGLTEAGDFDWVNSGMEAFQLLTGSLEKLF